MINKIPSDPIILFSFINMQLRDNYSSLQAFCDDNDVEPEAIERVLAAAGFEYNEELNQFR